MSRLAANGAVYEVREAGEGTPLLLVHGFTGRGSSWGPHIPPLRRAGFRTIVVDLLGHGRSDTPEDPARYAVERQAEDLAVILERLEATPAHIVGYSMGARIALRLACERPELVRRLVLEGGGAGIADPEARATRRASDEAIADRLEREGITAFVDYWESQPIFAMERRLPEKFRSRRRAERLHNAIPGLAASLRGAGQGAQEPIHGLLGSLTAPTLLLVGELDAPARARADEIIAAAPNAEIRIEVIPHAGHATHIEKPALFRKLVIDWLNDGEPDADLDLDLNHTVEGFALA